MSESKSIHVLVHVLILISGIGFWREVLEIWTYLNLFPHSIHLNKSSCSNPLILFLFIFSPLCSAFEHPSFNSYILLRLRNETCFWSKVSELEKIKTKICLLKSLQWTSERTSELPRSTCVLTQILFLKGIMVVSLSPNIFPGSINQLLRWSWGQGSTILFKNLCLSYLVENNIGNI